MVVSLPLWFVPDWKIPPSCDQYIRCRQRGRLSAALPCLCEKTEGGILSAQVREWMTVYLWAFLCSRLSVLYHQILLVLCVQHDRCDFTYKALILQLCVSKITKRKISSISLISLMW